MIEYFEQHSTFREMFDQTRARLRGVSTIVDVPSIKGLIWTSRFNSAFRWKQIVTLLSFHAIHLSEYYDKFLQLLSVFWGAQLKYVWLTWQIMWCINNWIDRLLVLILRTTVQTNEFIFFNLRNLSFKKQILIRRWNRTKQNWIHSVIY